MSTCVCDCDERVEEKGATDGGQRCVCVTEPVTRHRQLTEEAVPAV